MKIRIMLALALALAPAGGPLESQDPKGLPVEKVELGRPVDFAQDIQPIFKTSCLACHNAKDADGDLILETPLQMFKGGESGPAILSGKADESLLFKAAAQRAKPFMPPPKNKIGAKPLTPRELGLLKLWIDQGAKGSASAAALPLPKLKATPAAWNPIYAVALDADGQFAACGRAGRLFIYHVPSRQLVARPADPALSAFGKDLAHTDAVQALAFSPDGSLLATGGYRSLKIWKRDQAERQVAVENAADLKLAALSPDGARAAVSSSAGLRVVDLSSGKTLAALKGLAGDATSIRFSADGALVLGLSAQELRLWKSDGTDVGRLSGVAPPPPPPPAPDPKLQQAAATAQKAYDEAKQAAAAAEKALADAKDDEARKKAGEAKAQADQKAADLRTKRDAAKAAAEAKPAPAPAPAAPVLGVASAEWLDAGRVALGGADGLVRIWAVPPGDKPLKEIKAHAGPVTDLRMSAAGLVTVSQDGRARLWNLETAAQVREANAQAPLSGLAVSADGKRWITVAATGAAKLWDGERALLIADLKTDGPARRTDAQVAALAAFATSETAYVAGRVKAAEDEKKKEDDEAKKAADAVAPVEKAAKEKADALAKASKDREAADQALASAKKDFDAVKAKSEGAAKELADAATEEGLKKIEASHAALAKELDAAAKAVEKATARAQAAAKGLADAKAADAAAAKPAPAPDKAAAEKALAEAQKAYDEAKKKAAAAAEAVAAAKDDAAKKKAEAEKAEADKAAAELRTKRNDARAKVEAAAKTPAAAPAGPSDAAKQAETEKAAADQAAAEAQKALEKAKSAPGLRLLAYARAHAALRADAKNAAAKADADRLKKELEGEGAGTDQSLKAADAKAKEAEKKRDDLKKAEEAAAAANESAKLAFESARRRAEKSKEIAAAGEREIAAAKADLEKQQAEQKRLEAERKKTQDAAAKAARAVRAASLSANGALALLLDEDGRVFAFGGDKGDEGPVFAPAGKGAAAVGLRADGALVSLAADGAARSAPLYPSWSLLRTIEPSDPMRPPVDRVTALTFSPDGKQLVSGGGVPSREGEVLFWNVADGSLAKSIADAHSDAVYDLAFSPDGTRLATVAADKFAKVWDASSGKIVKVFEGHTHHVLGVSWSRTGRSLATAGGDNVVKVWNLTTGQQQRSIGGFPKQVTAIRHLGYDARFAVTTGGNQLRIVREDGNNERNFEGLAGFVYALAASADGQLLAAGGMDGVLRVWRSQAGQAIASFDPPGK
jgi:WD40 repeat protein